MYKYLTFTIEILLQMLNLIYKAIEINNVLSTLSTINLLHSVVN